MYFCAVVHCVVDIALLYLVRSPFVFSCGISMYYICLSNISFLVCLCNSPLHRPRILGVVVRLLRCVGRHLHCFVYKPIKPLCVLFIRERRDIPVLCILYKAAVELVRIWRTVSNCDLRPDAFGKPCKTPARWVFLQLILFARSELAMCCAFSFTCALLFVCKKVHH